MIAVIVAVAVIVVALLAAATAAVKIVREYQRVVLFRLGRSGAGPRPWPGAHQPDHRPGHHGRPARTVPRGSSPGGYHG